MKATTNITGGEKLTMTFKELVFFPGAGEWITVIHTLIFNSQFSSFPQAIS